MKEILFSFFIVLFCHITSTAQNKENPVDPAIEQQLENITENSEDMETEDDAYLQEMSQYKKISSTSTLPQPINSLHCAL